MRKKLITIYLISIVLLLTGKPLNGAWWIYKSTGIVNKEGHGFQIEKITDGTIRAVFTIVRELPEVLDKKLPLYQVDDNKVHDLSLKADLRVLDPKKGDRIRWRISAPGKPLSPDLLEIMNGREITFQFYPPDGSIEETTFSLEGAREKIEEILR